MTGALENCQLAVNVSQDWEASFTFKTLCFVEIILNLSAVLVEVACGSPGWSVGSFGSRG